MVQLGCTLIHGHLGVGCLSRMISDYHVQLYAGRAERFPFHPSIATSLWWVVYARAYLADF